MTRNEVESLFGSIYERWSTGNIENLERDFSEEVLATVDGVQFGLDDLRERIVLFYDQYEFLDSKIEDFIFDEDTLAIRLYAQIRRREDEEIIEDTFHWFFEMKENQVTKYWAITNYSFGFSDPKFSLKR